MPQSWSKDEEKQLLKEIKEGKKFDDLAKIHDRSISALMMRINKIIYENIESGKSKESMAKLLNITLDKVNQSYYEHKAFLEKKGIQNEVKKKDTESDKSVSVSTKSTKLSNKNEEDKLQKIINKLNVVETENKLLKRIIENMRLKKNLGKKINNNDLLREVLNLLKTNKNK